MLQNENSADYRHRRKIRSCAGKTLIAAGGLEDPYKLCLALRPTSCGGAEIQRLCESRVYPHGDAVRDFGYDPMPFEEGLRQEVREYLAAKNGKN